jgi:nicotinamide-nucleotide amidase
MTASVEHLAHDLRLRGETLAVAESCTGGLLGATLTQESGSSQWFRGGLIVYSNDLKIRLAGVSPGLLRRWGAVSAPVAAALAAGVRKRTRSDWGIGITGIAGPTGGLPGKPVGLVFIGVNGQRGRRVVRRIFHGTREDIRTQACQAALDLLMRVLRARVTAGPA